jgi:hypothetical protein
VRDPPRTISINLHHPRKATCTTPHRAPDRTRTAANAFLAHVVFSHQPEQFKGKPPERAAAYFL